MSKEKRAWGISIVAALFCPCCALPAMLSFIGSTGAIVQFEWLHQLRPVFIVIAMGSLIFLWRSYFLHQKQHANGQITCSGHHGPYQNKYFLFGLTIFICVMTTLPFFYS